MIRFNENIPLTFGGNNKNAVIEFGAGDINVTSGWMTENKKIVLVCFNNQEPKEIGSNGEIPAGTEIHADLFDVVMEFNKKESIDVVIRALQAARENLELAESEAT